MDEGSPTLVRVGDVIAGRYRVDRVIGKGAMGIVVAATHIELHQVRAIKFMLPEALNDKESVERFLREARAAARLESQHAVKVHDVARLPSGEPYIVMEHLEGIDLKQYLAKRRVLPVAEAVTFILQACEALAEAHSAGIIHRDLKPANLFLVERPGGARCIKVLDFGIAKVHDAIDSETGGQLTSTHTVIGSPLYMSPEQILSTRNVDARSDVWSLGVILYALVTGMVPFRGDSTHAIFASVQRDDPIPPSNWVPHLPLGLERVILSCLDKDPARRCQGVAALAAGIMPFAPESARRLFPSAYLGPAAAPVASDIAMVTQVWRPPSPQQLGQGSAPQDVHGSPSLGSPNAASPGYSHGAASAPAPAHAHATRVSSQGYSQAPPVDYSQKGSPPPTESQPPSSPSHPRSGTQNNSYGAPPPSSPQPGSQSYSNAAPPSYPQPGAQTDSPVIHPLDGPGVPRKRGREALLVGGGFCTALIIVGAFFFLSRGSTNPQPTPANSEAVTAAPALPSPPTSPAVVSPPLETAAPSAPEAPAAPAENAASAAMTAPPPPGTGASTAAKPRSTTAPPASTSPAPVSKPPSAPPPTSKSPAPAPTPTGAVPLRKRHD
jgi:serine/threonine-protein kinase